MAGGVAVWGEDVVPLLFLDIAEAEMNYCKVHEELSGHPFKVKERIGEKKNWKVWTSMCDDVYCLPFQTRGLTKLCYANSRIGP